MEKKKDPYDDIINLPHPVSQKHPPMPMKNRAAQFSPFAALNGHNGAIREVLRETEPRRTLGESDLELLDRKLSYLQEHLAERQEIVATYFRQDRKKEGGQYIQIFGIAKKIDFYQRLLLLEDGMVIPLEDIFDLSGELFDNIL